MLAVAGMTRRVRGEGDPSRRSLVDKRRMGKRRLNELRNDMEVV
ncbi:hypothetical protein [Amycolatopsis alkalitolerans]|nr:hypothetical protein [Amycolatopsis alkalitolerans]